MVTYERGEQIGVLLRRLRRQRNLTQTELGGTQYSKSYVSAVEKNKIRPSSQALEFFAQQLDQPVDYFITWIEDLNSDEQSGLHEPTVMNGLPVIWYEQFTILDRLLESVDHFNFAAGTELPPTSEHIDALPPALQARYYLMKGLEAQAKQKYSAALLSLEHALPLAPERLQPLVLDALGRNYFMSQSFATALHYHLRALSLLQQNISNESDPSLLFRVELHCAEDYRVLGSYSQACNFYERANSHLRAEHNMKTAALLYLGFGYCTYALLYQSFIQAPLLDRMTSEESVRKFHKVRGFLIQSRSIAQACRAREGESNARLTLAMAELDFSTRRRQLAQRRVGASGNEHVPYQTSFLEDAEEQCRQILLNWQDAISTSSVPPEPFDTTIFIALAYLVRIFIQRAALSRLIGNQDTALRERILAANLCQQVLDALQQSSFPDSLLRLAASLKEGFSTTGPPTLSLIPNLSAAPSLSQHSPVSQAEIYFAAGEVAQELGSAATSPHYINECYSYADQYLHASLNCARSAVSLQKLDSGYLVRSYQRWISMLQERATFNKETDKASLSRSLDRLNEALSQLQRAFWPAVWKAEEN